MNAAGGIALGTVRESVGRGCGWLESHLRPDGSLDGSLQAAVYFKCPAVLMLCGRLDLANRCLGWIERNFLAPDGGVRIPDEQERATACNTYDRGWLCWGAGLCGRYDLAYRLAADLLEYQDPATGGFWDSAAARLAREGRQHAMTAGMSGLALLAIGRLQQSADAGHFVSGMLEQQRGEGLFLACDVGAGGARLRTEKSLMDYLDGSTPKQRPARLGPIMVHLVRLHRVTREPALVRAAALLRDTLVRGGEQTYLCVEGHKFVWGIAELDAVAPDTTGASASAADRIVAYLLERQRPEGQWLAEASASGQEQSFALRVNTTCNALAGLLHYGWWERRA